MLGFSPLASAPLADTGAVAEAALVLATNIVTGAPTVAASTISQVHALTSDDITAGVPTVASNWHCHCQSCFNVYRYYSWRTHRLLHQQFL